MSRNDLLPLSQQLILLFEELPQTQQRITLEYVKQQVALTVKAEEHEFRDQYVALKTKKPPKKSPQH